MALDDRPRTTQEQFSQFAADYDAVNKAASGGLDQLIRHRFARRLRARVPAGMPPVIADLGLGTGMMSAALARAFGPEAFVVGIERNDAMAALAEAHGTEAEISLGDAMALPLRAGSVDVAVFCFSLSDMPDPGAALREAQRVLRPGGILGVAELSTPPNRFLRSTYLALLRPPLKFASWRSKVDLSHLLAEIESGWSVLDTEAVLAAAGLLPEASGYLLGGATAYVIARSAVTGPAADRRGFAAPTVAGPASADPAVDAPAMFLPTRADAPHSSSPLSAGLNSQGVPPHAPH